MNSIKCLLVATFTLLSLGVMLTSCGGSGSSGGGVSINCSVPALGLRYDQAIADINQRGLSPKDNFMAVSAMERLTAIGVSVSSAYQLVIASIEHHIDHIGLAALVSEIESDSCPIVTTDITTTAINNNYSLEVVGAVLTGAKAGAGCDIPAEIVCKGIQKKLDVNTIRSIMDGFVTDINNGLSPEEARDNAIKKINNF